jgi:DNA-binding CsgD family transcriptional regulator
MLELRAGDWELGARYAAESLAVETQFGYAVQPGDELPAAAIAAHRGEIAEARARSERALALSESTGIRISQSAHRWVLGFIELSLGNPAGALEYLREGWAIRDDVRMLEPGQRFELADTLEALIAVGDLDEAERLLPPWEERSRVLDRAWAMAIVARCRGLVLAARGDFSGAWPCFEQALEQHARVQDPFQHARTLLALGVTQRRAKQRREARKTLEQALEIFERLGAPLWAGKARAELARIGGRAPASDVLTEGERRIVAGVAAGGKNREVAAALFLSEHTVETVLSRAYRKLGVRSRSELTRLMGPQTDGDPPSKS